MMLTIPLDITTLAIISKMKYILITEVERLGFELKPWATNIKFVQYILPQLADVEKSAASKKQFYVAIFYNKIMPPYIVYAILHLVKVFSIMLHNALTKHFS